LYLFCFCFFVFNQFNKNNHKKKKIKKKPCARLYFYAITVAQIDITGDWLGFLIEGTFIEAANE